MKGGLNKAFAIAIAIQFQIIGLLATAWLIGSWLNQKYPISINWYVITFTVSVIAIIQMLIKMYFHFKKRI